MSFVERLERQKAIRDQEERERIRVAQQQETEKLRANEKRQRDINTANSVLENASVVNDLAHELAKSLGERIGYYGGYGNPREMCIILEYIPSEKSHKVIAIHGNSNGTIQIGSTILTPDNFNDPIKVDQALEVAYKKPTLKGIPQDQSW